MKNRDTGIMIVEQILRSSRQEPSDRLVFRDCEEK